MKNFFKYFLASFLAICAALLILLLITLGSISSMLSSKSPEAKIKPNTILVIDVSQAIADRRLDQQFDPVALSSMDFKGTLGLYDILTGIRKAATDPNIDGILLKSYLPMTGITNLAEIRKELESFRESGKFIIAYSDLFTQSGYYLASVADEVYMGHEGIFEFKGLSSQVLFFAKALDKLGINVQVIREGKYKSAVEPFLLESMSAENREQIAAYVNTLWEEMAGDMAASRNIKVEEINRLANGWIPRTPELALAANLVDSLLYEDELEVLLKHKTALPDAEKLRTIGIDQYRLVPPAVKEEYSADRIAIIYGLGSISMRASGSQSIGADLAQSFKRARNDDRIKAVVFRINSPGGDALASDIIRREVELTAKEKPVIVSMGEVAGSGGYWIAAPATRIVAGEMTLTGSIGAFGMVPDISKLLNDKLGIMADGYKTHEMGDAGSLLRPLTPAERRVYEDLLSTTYDNFVKMVAGARNMSPAEVDAVGQGRIWSGRDAVSRGLVDETGGIMTALDLAAQEAGITNYRIRELPVLKDPLQEILNQVLGRNLSLTNTLASEIPVLGDIRELTRGGRIQARIPYRIEIQ